MINGLDGPFNKTYQDHYDEISLYKYDKDFYGLYKYDKDFYDLYLECLELIESGSILTTVLICFIFNLLLILKK